MLSPEPAVPHAAPEPDEHEPAASELAQESAAEEEPAAAEPAAAEEEPAAAADSDSDSSSSSSDTSSGSGSAPAASVFELAQEPAAEDEPAAAPLNVAVEEEPAASASELAQEPAAEDAPPPDALKAKLREQLHKDFLGSALLASVWEHVTGQSPELLMKRGYALKSQPKLIYGVGRPTADGRERPLFRWGIDKSCWRVMQEMPAVYVEIIDAIEARFGVRPNHCMANYMPDGTYGLPMHQDQPFSPECKGYEATEDVFVLSLGVPRPLVFGNLDQRGKQSEVMAVGAVTSAHGDLFVLSADLNASYVHGILKYSAVFDQRVSLTFRRIEHSWVGDTCFTGPDGKQHPLPAKEDASKLSAVRVAAASSEPPVKRSRVEGQPAAKDDVEEPEAAAPAEATPLPQAKLHRTALVRSCKRRASLALRRGRLLSKEDAEETERILLDLDAQDEAKEIEDAALEFVSKDCAELEESGGDKASDDRVDEASDDAAMVIAHKSPTDMGSEEGDEDQDSKSSDGLSTGSAEGSEDVTDLKVELEQARQELAGVKRELAQERELREMAEEDWRARWCRRDLMAALQGGEERRARCCPREERRAHRALAG